MKTTNVPHNVPRLLKGTELTAEQITMLPFRGKSNPEWVKNHSFYFKDGKPTGIEDNGFYYPVCNSLSHLPY